MRYMGGKHRHAEAIVAAILERVPRPERTCWVEPFVGAASVISAVETWHGFECRLGNDANWWLIQMFRAIQRGWVPPATLTEAEYAELRAYQQHPDGSRDPALVAFAGIAGSFGAKWYGGYARDPSGKIDFIANGRRSLIKQYPKLLGVEFTAGDYRSLVFPERSVIYCDPPYAGTTGYDFSQGFDSVAFWRWVNDQTDAGHRVFVSEYAAPFGWRPIWSKEVNSSVDVNTGGKASMEYVFARV